MTKLQKYENAIRCVRFNLNRAVKARRARDLRLAGEILMTARSWMDAAKKLS